jgi:hypothetical protein
VPQLSGMQITYFMRRIALSSVACPGLPYFFILSHKRHDFRENVIEDKICFDFLYNFLSETFFCSVEKYGTAGQVTDDNITRFMLLHAR